MKYASRCFPALLLSLTLTLSGCGAPSDSVQDSPNQAELIDRNEPVTISVWHYYNGVQQVNFDKAVQEFNNTIGLQQGIIVEAYSKGSISELSDSVIASVKGSAGADDPPDIFTAYAETAYTIDQLGSLADIRQYFTDEELAEYVDAYIEEGRFSGDDTLKIFPTAKSTEVMILNLTDWQAFADAENVTTDALQTWEGVTEIAEKYYTYTDALTPDVPNDGRAFFGRDSVANYMIVGAKQLGAEFVSLDETGKPVLQIDETAVRRLWDNYYVPYVKGYYTIQGRYRSDDVKLGKSIAIICSTTGAAYYPSEVTINDDYTYPIESMVLAVPNFENAEPYAVQQGAGMSVIRSDAQKEYASAVFLKWFTEEERNIEFSINSGYLPVKKSANDFGKISEINQNSENAANEITLRSLEFAIEEVNNYAFYTMKPFETASETRDYLGNYIQTSAESAYAEALKKIQDGGNREEILTSYTDDAAFQTWFAVFCSSLEELVK
ncbi:MAG: extracellular solute-binding protein [Oscillospiraceae bacterium]|nr:extracellular solute-binding protein [Oscillospiraceae bacterium]